jgi:hypothetical protein
MATSKKGGGGDEPSKQLTPQNMADWNKFLDWVRSKGFEGSKELDHNEPLAKSLFVEYKKANPSTTVDYSIVPLVQTEMQKLRDNAQAFASRRVKKSITRSPGSEKYFTSISRSA